MISAEREKIVDIIQWLNNTRQISTSMNPLWDYVLDDTLTETELEQIVKDVADRYGYNDRGKRKAPAPGGSEA